MNKKILGKVKRVEMPNSLLQEQSRAIETNTQIHTLSCCLISFTKNLCWTHCSVHDSVVLFMLMLKHQLFFMS